VLVGFETSDDGAVYRLSDDLAVVQSIDVLTPVVDNPTDFGRIAAANSVSDLYAMGAEPKFALSFAGFPKSVLPLDVLQKILAGGTAVAHEAGMVVIGGHTIDDPEPKYGLAVTGTVHPDRIVTNRAGEAGDILILTKPLGSGVITTANKRGKATSDELAEAVEMMATLNAGAARAMQSVHAKCATDVTGFGLLGHLHEMANGSGLMAELSYSSIPILEAARRLVIECGVPGGSRRNLSHLQPHLTWQNNFHENDQLLLADAQTSGGLLIAVKPEAKDALLTQLTQENTPVAAVVGRLVTGPAGHITIQH